ncbi:LPS assembly lipoprotein LptE [Ramlibacter solisilvae]|uniref:LPS-assembly lipoprotein LptE n=1 Tax=Ramlibacter tataouinensis TaxID=94132 RepID=A0A127JTY2_9BURK|nr:LPS assembly lipoprotein LptE [Ramlibacter tataouinensis]AMO23374.1 membrane protein [Ramlibacter tataouinensis]
MPRGGPSAWRRRTLLLASSALALAGCGFQLRQAPSFAFSTIYIGAAPGSSLGNELKRSIASNESVKVVSAPTPELAQVILDITADQREKVVVGLSAAGQVREFQLRTRMRFKLRTPQGKELIPETELLQQRDISYNESAALAKEAEEGLLYRDMQTDLVQQLMRRLAAVKSI